MKIHSKIVKLLIKICLTCSLAIFIIFSTSKRSVEDFKLSTNKLEKTQMTKLLQSLLPTGKPKLVLLWTQKRSGSRLVGGMLDLNKRLYYIDEPIDTMGVTYQMFNSADVDSIKNLDSSTRVNSTSINLDQNRNLDNGRKLYPLKIGMDIGMGIGLGSKENLVKNIAKDISSFLRKVLECDDDLRKTNLFLDSVNSKGYANEIRYLTEIKLIKKSLLTNFILAECQSASTRLAKVVVPPLWTIQGLFQVNSLDFKVIFLVRDPRAILNSRSKFEGHSFLTVDSPCVKLIDDWRWYKIFKKKYPKKINLIYYEDLIMDSINTVKKLYEFLNEPFNAQIQNAVARRTKVRVENAEYYGLYKDLRQSKFKRLFSLYQESSSKINEWREQMSFENVSQIQKICGPALRNAGYRIFRNEAQLKNFTFGLFENRPE